MCVQLALYNLFLFLYLAAIHIVSLFDEKAKKWLAGRADIISKIRASMQGEEQRIWIHCASVGEFEQARPLIEALKKEHPDYKIVLTFFSPSGYELRKNYELADYVFYLPMDGASRSRKFLDAVKPQLAVFVKYEFWYHYIFSLEQANIPVVLVCGAFRQEQIFFKWYGGLFRKILGKFSFFFLQDEQSAELLRTLHITGSVKVAGDTRYDRVYEIAKLAKSFPLIESWKGDDNIVVAGSTWPDDEQVIKDIMETLPENWKLILAPHEINKSHIHQITQLFRQPLLYSTLQTGIPVQNKVLVIDNIGMLSSLYRYGDIAYIGGGFQKGGIHNTLEPAVFGLPIIFGPVYEKFVEARLLVEKGFAFSIENVGECKLVLDNLIADKSARVLRQQLLREFVSQNIGATKQIMEVLSREYLD